MSAARTVNPRNVTSVLLQKSRCKGFLVQDARTALSITVSPSGGEAPARTLGQLASLRSLMCAQPYPELILFLLIIL